MSDGIYRVGPSVRYRRPRTPRYHRRDCPGTFAGLVSRSVIQEPSYGGPTKHSSDPEPSPVTRDFLARAWRVATIVGPLVAIALTLAAGRRW